MTIWRYSESIYLAMKACDICGYLSSTKVDKTVSKVNDDEGKIEMNKK